MFLNDVLEDVAERLSLGDGVDLTAKERNTVIRGLRRLFDRFSIDTRKMPMSCELKHKITSNNNRLSIGEGKTFDVWGEPGEILYAAWKHCEVTPQECSIDRTYRSVGFCDEMLGITKDAQAFYSQNCLSDIGRPTEMYWEKDEIQFNSRPQIGDTLMIRAVMPFDVSILTCESRTPIQRGKLVEFQIEPKYVFDHETRCSILREAKEKYNGRSDWCLKTYARPCGDECAKPTPVLVTARPVEQFCPDTISMSSVELPKGYYSAITNILTYDLAPWARIERTQDMREDRSESITLIHRRNVRPIAEPNDNTVPWSRRKRRHDDDESHHIGVDNIRGL